MPVVTRSLVIVVLGTGCRAVVVGRSIVVLSMAVFEMPPGDDGMWAERETCAEVSPCSCVGFVSARTWDLEDDAVFGLR